MKNDEKRAVIVYCSMHSKMKFSIKILLSHRCTHADNVGIPSFYVMLKLLLYNRTQEENSLEEISIKTSELLNIPALS